MSDIISNISYGHSPNQLSQKFCRFCENVYEPIEKVSQNLKKLYNIWIGIQVGLAALPLETLSFIIGFLNGFTSSLLSGTFG